MQVPDCDYFYIIKILLLIHSLSILMRVKSFGGANVEFCKVSGQGFKLAGFAIICHGGS